LHFLTGQLFSSSAHHFLISLPNLSVMGFWVVSSGSGLCGYLLVTFPSAIIINGRDNAGKLPWSDFAAAAAAGAAALDHDETGGTDNGGNNDEDAWGENVSLLGRASLPHKILLKNLLIEFFKNRKFQFLCFFCLVGILPS
jgi:hypothetical protein